MERPGLQFIETKESLFDRQQMISWWSQEKLANARVMVVGAGAIGNEVLKNLALLGVGYIFVADFDHIEKTNLSRTVLFRKEDMGKSKAEIAAHRTRELALADNFKIDWFHGDVIWKLGAGIFREMDLVLGCLDNLETRYAVNRMCWLVGVPWIDAGIRELDGSVSCFSPPEAPCYACSMQKQVSVEKKKRYACGDLKRKAQQEGKVATVQIAAARVAALQVQEAVKFLHGNTQNSGQRILFQGHWDGFEKVKLPVNSKCLIHQLSFDQAIRPLELSSSESLETFLQEVSKADNSGEGAALDISGELWTFIQKVNDERGGEVILNKPNFSVYDEDIGSLSANDALWQIKRLSRFSLETSPAELLQMSLAEIGVSHAAVLNILDSEGRSEYYQLNGDLPKLLPEYHQFKSISHE